MSTRRVVWCLLLWSAMWIASARAQPIVLDVVPGFDGVCPGEGCYPVTVWIQGRRANPAPTVYEVEVTGLSWKGSAFARKSVTLSGEAVSQAVSLLLCTPDEPYEVTARLVLRGRVLATSKPVSATMAQWYPLLVGLGEESSALSHLPQQSLGVVSIEGKLVVPDEGRLPAPPPFPPDAVPDKRRVYIGRVRNSLPPESALAYRGVAAVSLDDRAWDTLNERQQQALIGYVLSGGLLVVHGLDINRLQSLVPSGLLPVEPLGLSSVPPWAMERWIPSLSEDVDELDVVRSRPLGEAKVLLQWEGTPLVVVAKKGLGQVVFLAFDPGQPPFRGDVESYALWKNLLRLQTGRFTTPTAVFPESDSISSTPQVGGKDFYSDMIRAMVNAVAAKPVPLNWLIAYLGVYILVLIPMNYLVLRKLDRLHLSWFTLPMLAVLTSLGGYLMASEVQVGSHQMRQWTALYTASGSPHAVVESDWVLYSARTQRYRLQAKIDGTILENSPSDLQARRVAEIPQDIPADVQEVPIPLWSARSFHLSGIMNLQGSVSVSARRESNVLRFKVRNNTRYRLSNFRLVTSLGVVPLGGTCSPGAQIDLSVRRGAPVSVPLSPDLPYYYGRRSPLSDTSDGGKWQEQVNNGWLGLVFTRLPYSVATYIPDGSSMPAVQGTLPRTNISQGVLVAEAQGVPPVVEVTPLPSSSSQQVTVLAVHFNVQDGRR